MNGPTAESTGGDAPGMAGALFQHAAEALLLVDPLSERVLDVNDQMTALSEMSREELLGLPLRALLRHEQEWQDWAPPVHEKAFVAEEGFLLRTRREDHWVEVGVRLCRVPLPGAGLTVLVTLQDRRTHVELTRRVQRLEAELRCIISSSSDCLWSCRVDPEGHWRYRYLAPTVQRFTGRPPSAFLDDPHAWEQSVDAEDQPAWQQFRERLHDGYSAALEYRLRRAGGERVWVRENVIVTPDEGGLLLNGILTDISERKRSQSATSQSLARHRLDGVAALAGTVAHDFNNLITGILGHVSLARLTTPAHSGLEQIEAITLRAADVCRHLATIAGKTRSNGQVRDVSAVVRQTLAHAEQGQPRVRVEIAPDLPPVLIDEMQFRQVLEALWKNATEALNDGPGDIVVRVRRAPAEEETPANFTYRAGELTGPVVALEVGDTGPGMPADALARLGEPFRTTTPGKRGLGLALVLGIARAHEGGVDVHTGVGQGTLVRVLLPGASVAAAGQALATVPSRAEGGHRHGTVLLADDEETVLDVAGRLLRSVGCEVVSARDGEEALACFRRHGKEIHLALVDLTMPRLCGEPMLRELRQLAPELPLVLMSGFPESDVLPRFAELRLAGYLQKPFRLPALLELLHKVMPE